MSNYPQWWNQTITIYNKYEDPLTHIISWFRFSVGNCFWKYTGDKISIGETVLETNNIICRIPENGNFLEKYLWIQKPNDAMGNYFTLGPGDIIIKGDVSDTVDEYISGQRSTDLIAKYKSLQGCMEIQEVAINIGGGRNQPHDYVKGI